VSQGPGLGDPDCRSGRAVSDLIAYSDFARWHEVTATAGLR